MYLNCRLSRNRHNNTFASRNGSQHMVQFHSNSRTQSILQTETSVLWEHEVFDTQTNIQKNAVLRLTWVH